MSIFDRNTSLGFPVYIGCPITPETPEGPSCGIKKSIICICHNCNKYHKIKLPQCSRCGTFYCDRKCQRDHWRHGHKIECEHIRTQKMLSIENR